MTSHVADGYSTDDVRLAWTSGNPVRKYKDITMAQFQLIDPIKYFAKDDVDSVKEIAGGLSSSSDEEPTPPPRVKFPIEKRKPAPSLLSNGASGHRSRSPRRARPNLPACVTDHATAVPAETLEHTKKAAHARISSNPS